VEDQVHFLLPIGGPEIDSDQEEGAINVAARSIKLQKHVSRQKEEVILDID
jgi:hypothetical protein